MSFWNKLFKRRSRHQAVMRMIDREPSEMTVAEWRGNELYCAEARNVLASPTVSRMLQVLVNSHPAFNVMLSGDISDRAVQQARGEGYTQCLEDLKSLARYDQPMEIVESTFKDEEITQSQLSEYGLNPKKSAAKA